MAMALMVRRYAFVLGRRARRATHIRGPPAPNHVSVLNSSGAVQSTARIKTLALRPAWVSGETHAARPLRAARGARTTVRGFEP
jgi:hypothetical protein